MKQILYKSFAMIAVLFVAVSCGGGSSGNGPSNPDGSGDDQDMTQMESEDMESADCDAFDPISAVNGGRSTSLFNGSNLTFHRTISNGSPFATTGYTYDLSDPTGGRIVATTEFESTGQGIDQEISDYSLDGDRLPTREDYRDLGFSPPRSNLRSYSYDAGLLTRFTFENTDEFSPSGEDAGAETAAFDLDYEPRLRTIQSIVFSADGEVLSNTQFDWDCTVLLGFTIYEGENQDSVLSAATSTRSDDESQLQFEYTGESGEFLGRKIYEFDELGNLVRVRQTNESDAVFLEENFEYNTGFFDVVNMGLLGLELNFIFF